MLRKDKVLREEVVSEIGGNRRDRHRYDIDLNVHYKVLGQCRVGQSGTGRTVNLSGGGLAITIGEVVSPGSAIEVAVAWPQMLNGNCPLKLVITGKVVRSTSLMTAIRMERYEFRTQGMRTMQVSAAAFSA